MSWFLAILFLGLTFGCFSDEGGHDKKLPSAVVVGTVYCDTCFQQDFSMGSHFIPGASVGVECKDGSSNPRFKKEVKTNEHGEFRVELPFSVSKHVKRIKGCTVKLISSSEPYCAVASSATSSSLLLKSRKQGLHIFSAGFFSFKTLKLPILCNQKPSIHHNTNKGLVGLVKKLSSDFPPPIQDPNTPSTALPTLPPLPPLPGIPAPWSQITAKTSKKAEFLDQKLAGPEDFMLPPNPFQPAPQIPNPFQPPPSSGQSPLFPFPSVPGLSPSSSPTPPSLTPSFPFPFPPWSPPHSASSTNNASP